MSKKTYGDLFIPPKTKVTSMKSEANKKRTAKKAQKRKEELDFLEEQEEQSVNKTQTKHVAKDICQKDSPREDTEESPKIRHPGGPGGLPRQRNHKPLSQKEQKFIHDSIGKLTLDEIAGEIGCTRIRVEKYVIAKRLVGDITDTDQRVVRIIVRRLKQESFWEDMGKKYEKRDIDRFVKDWVKYMLQFHEDIKASEKDQLKQAIEVHIEMDALFRSRQQNKIKIEKLEKDLDKLYNEEPEDRDMVRINSLESSLAATRSATAYAAKEWREMQDKHEKLLKNLNATREKRVHNLENSKTTWPRLLEEIEENPLKKQQMGVTAYLHYLAFKKAKIQLTQPHVFQDENEDYPLIIPEEEAEGLNKIETSVNIITSMRGDSPGPP